MALIIICAALIATIVYVGVDSAKNRIPSSRKKTYTMFNGVITWTISTFILWIIAFPSYIITRIIVQKAKNGRLLVTDKMHFASGIAVYLAICISFMLYVHNENSFVQKCSDQRTISTVLEIVNTELSKYIIIDDTVSISLESIETTMTNNEMGKCDCAANLKVESVHGSEIFPITYTLEATGERGGDYQVFVYGLY